MQLTKDHEEINAMLGDLYTQLNALTNFNYTPRVAEIDVQTISNIPVIAMEEATPGARDGAAGVGKYCPSLIIARSFFFRPQTLRMLLRID